MFTELEKYLTQTASDKSPHTLRSYSGSLIRFCEAMKLSSVEQIVKLTSSNVQDYLYSLKNNGLVASSVNGHLRNLEAFFNWLNLNGYENKLKLKTFKQTKTIKNVPSSEEIRSMIAVAKGSKKLLITLMCFSGMRREEITNIKVSDIDGCHILIHGKGRKERKLALHEDVCKLMNKYLAHRKTDFEYLFFSRKSFAGRGNAMPHKLTAESIRAAVKTAMLNAGIAPERVKTMSAHSLRRFFAVYMLKNNAPLSKIQLALGHSSPTTTAIYLQSAGAEIADDEINGLPSLM